MHISAKADYAVRALLTLATVHDQRMTIEELVASQGLPRKFLEAIMRELRLAGIVVSHRGAGGGHRLAGPADAISVADVLRAVDGPLAEVRGLRPECAAYTGSAQHLGTVWVAVRASLREVLEVVTIAEIVDGDFPAEVRRLISDPDAWISR